MPRVSKLWFRSANGYYYTKIDGKQHKLARKESEAQKMLYRLMGGDKTPRVRSRMSVKKLCDTYLVKTRGDKADERHKVQVQHLQAFCDKFGPRRPESLKVHEVNTWLDATGLGQSTKGLVVMILKAVMNWAAAEGHLSESPLKGLKRRKIARRDRVLTADERRRVLGAVGPYFRRFLTVLEQTGCRPFSEAAKLTAAMIDWEKGRAVLAKHKNDKQGRPRVIYFPPAVLDMLRELAADHPTGLLLRNRLGNRWTRDNAADYLKRAAGKLGIDPLTSYAFRHTYITDALAKGVPVEVVAELVGTSAKMIHQHYASLDKKADVLREAAVRAVSG